MNSKLQAIHGAVSAHFADAAHFGDISSRAAAVETDQPASLGETVVGTVATIAAVTVVAAIAVLMSLA
jgi:hypothetical protein